MSEIKLNLVDSETILSGTTHGSVADRCVAALSAEPETISELEAALERFEKSRLRFSQFFKKSYLDPEPYDAGIMTIDLAARIVACDSTYSQPGARGSVEYHNGRHCTDIPIRYYLPDDWLFVESIEHYECVRDERRKLRAAPLDARAVMYGTPLLTFIATNAIQSAATSTNPRANCTTPHSNSADQPPEEDNNPRLEIVRDIHRRWLLTPRGDLRGQSPRELLLAKQHFINRDLDSRGLQWNMQMEGPPGLDPNSFAYRYAGFGTHEWVVYYYMVRHLIWSAVDMAVSATESGSALTEAGVTLALEQIKTSWLNEPNREFESHVPIIIIENERRRMPEAMSGRTMVIDENCPLCKMMGDESEAGLAVYFWHLDGCNMDDEFAFSTFATFEEWEADQREMEERHKEFEREWKEREEKIARGEKVEPIPRSWVSPELEDMVPFPLGEPEPPEA